jgi:molecular chaperone DnaK
VFTTAADNQTQVEIHVLQGERPLAKDNLSLGRFILDGIPPAPRGVPQIEVTYAVDENGILHVTAKDKATGKEQHITITNSNKLSKEEIERMKKEAEKYAEADRKRAEEIETKNKADTLVYSGKKFLKEHGDKISPESKTEFENALNELEKAVKEGNIDTIKEKMDKVNEIMEKVGTEMYKASGGQTPPGGTTGTEGTGSTGTGDNNEGPTVEGEGTTKE